MTSANEDEAPGIFCFFDITIGYMMPNLGYTMNWNDVMIWRF